MVITIFVLVIFKEKCQIFPASQNRDALFFFVIYDDTLDILPSNKELEYSIWGPGRIKNKYISLRLTLKLQPYLWHSIQHLHCKDIYSVDVYWSSLTLLLWEFLWNSENYMFKNDKWAKAATDDYFLLFINMFVISSLKWSIVWSIECQKMEKDVHQCLPMQEMTSSEVLFRPQPKYIQLSVMKQ